MLLRLCLIAVSAAVLGTLPRAEGYTWPAIRYSPPNACGKNETFDQNSFVCIRCGRAERPRDTAEGGFGVPCSCVTEVMIILNGTARLFTGYGCECRADHRVVQDTGSYGPQANGLKCTRYRSSLHTKNQDL